MNPEVLRLLSYMPAFARPESYEAVAELMDLIAAAPSAGGVIVTKRRLPHEPDDRDAMYRIAAMAHEAVAYAEGGRRPEWLAQLSINL